MDWNTVFATLLGTAVPATVLALVMWRLNARTNAALERQKTDLAAQLAILDNDLSRRVAMFTAWHAKRLDALVEIYEAFRIYLDWLRRMLYVPGTRESMDGMWDFRTAVEKNLVYLDDDLRREIEERQSRLLLFWNWAMEQERPGGIVDDVVQHRLDFEIPSYLEELRAVINVYADPYVDHDDDGRPNKRIERTPQAPLE